MRIFKAFLTVLILVSCDKEVKNFKPQSSGRINSISVIIDKPSWDGKIGDAIRDKYASEFIGLPQVEEAFTLNYIPYEAFTGFGRTARNVIYINKKKQDKPRMIRDRYARPQLFLEVSGLDNESIIQGILSSFEFSSAQFQNGEITENKNRILNSLLKDTGLDSLNISLNIPSAYSVFKSEPETVWLQKPLKNGTSNLKHDYIKNTSCSCKFLINRVFFSYFTTSPIQLYLEPTSTIESFCFVSSLRFFILLCPSS